MLSAMESILLGFILTWIRLLRAVSCALFSRPSARDRVQSPALP